MRKKMKKVERARVRVRKEVEAEEDKFKKEKGQKVKDKENNKVNNKHKRTGSLVNNGNVKKKRLSH